MLPEFVLSIGLIMVSGKKYPECDTSLKPEPSDFNIIENDPTLDSDTLTIPPNIQYDESERLGELVKSHFYIGKRGKKILHGLYEVYSKEYMPGKLMETGGYRHNGREGRWTQWDIFGRLRSESNYKNGKLDGVSVLYRQNGVVAEKVKYTNGKFDCADGFAQGFYENGHLKFELKVINGIEIKDVRYDSLGRVIDPKK